VPSALVPQPQLLPSMVLPALAGVFTACGWHAPRRIATRMIGPRSMPKSAVEIRTAQLMERGERNPA
jgi:hypothetical protein